MSTTVPINGSVDIPDSVAGPAGPAGATGPVGPAGPQGPAGSSSSGGSSKTSNIDVNELNVYGRIKLHFDPTKKPYTELQWVDDSTGIVMGQIVTHTLDSTGNTHDHMSFYTYEPGQPNSRKHHFSLSWKGGQHFYEQDSAIIADYHNDAPVHHLWTSPGGKTFEVSIDDTGKFTSKPATNPAQ